MLGLYGAPPPPPGDIKASIPTIIGATPAAVNAAADDEGFTPISRTMGIKTTPLHLATATTMALSTTLQANKGGYNSFKSSEEEDSPPLLLDQPEATTTLNEDPADLIAAISESEHQRNLAFIQEVGKVDQIS